MKPTDTCTIDFLERIALADWNIHYLTPTGEPKTKSCFARAATYLCLGNLIKKLHCTDVEIGVQKVAQALERAMLFSEISDEDKFAIWQSVTQKIEQLDTAMYGSPGLRRWPTEPLMPHTVHDAHVDTIRYVAIPVPVGARLRVHPGHFVITDSPEEGLQMYPV